MASSATTDSNAPSSGPNSVAVRTASRQYHALVGRELLRDVPSLVTRALGSFPARAMIFADAGVPTAAAESLAHALRAAGVNVASRTFQPSEPSKSLETVGVMLEALTTHAMERSHPVIALGGGIVGDMAGFAAASYRRGVPWINCPSTLLSMVDASVGGKTGVNVLAERSLRKNMAGAFWQPSLVLADVDLLRSLPDRHFRSGLAECIKHSMLSGSFGDPALAEWTLSELPAITQRSPQLLQQLIARNIAVKARVIETDEREESVDPTSGRALLNLGHTFGHAIETLPQLSPTSNPADAPLQHGEAVALGLAAASHLSVLQHLAPPALHDRTVAMLQAAGLPSRVRKLPASRGVLAAMMHDKKVASGALRLVLPLPNATCQVVRDVPEAHVLAAIDSIRG